VRAAAAVGRPDRHAGEVPVAYVVPADPDRFDEAELHAWAGAAIGEAAARPRRIHPIPAIPTTAVGKQDKPALVADAASRAITDALTDAGIPHHHRAMTRPTPEITAMYPQNVIVVGAGPVGCTAALLLADRDIPVTLIERHREAHRCPEPSTSTTRSPGSCTASASATPSWPARGRPADFACSTPTTW
jgi:hypothetical protein